MGEGFIRRHIGNNDESTNVSLGPLDNAWHSNM